LPFPENWTHLKESVLARVKPSESDQEKIRAFIDNLEKGLTEALKSGGVDADVEVHGSVSRDTWLVGHRDIDTFIIIRNGKDRGELLRVNEIVKGYTGKGWVEAYAEHPYIRKMIQGFDVEFIPCFKAEKGRGFMSATDRTPLHTGYLIPRLTPRLRDDVRVLKTFMRGIGVYGAEIKLGGFSGYLCELLVVAYGSFEALIEAAASWGEHPLIQIEEAATPKFNEPLIVVDPVDPKRNVASAVTETALWTFVAASRSLMEKPGERFFNPPPRDTAVLLQLLGGRGSGIIFVVIRDEEPPVPDTLWGQLYRCEKAFGRIFGERGFNVFRSGTWSDEVSRHIFTYELESITLPPLVKKMGPPVRLERESDDFLRTYIRSPDLVSGPGIKGGKWWVVVRRRHLFTHTQLREVLMDASESIGVPKRLASLLEEHGRVYISEEIEGELKGGFPEWLAGFLSGRPDWLE
jgi:tRNA nucleotidyltransferase (CCA-adding enzyme)